MSYNIVYSELSESDLKDIAVYISQKLGQKNTAQRLVRRIIKEIKSLEDMPKRFRLYDRTLFHDLHFMPVENYIVFYYVNDENSTVYISRIFYAGRDISDLDL